STDTYTTPGDKTHVYADGPAARTITVDLVDQDGPHAGAGSKDVTVDDVPPTIALAGNDHVREGSSYPLTLGGVTDHGQDTVTSYIVHWADGSTDTFSTAGTKTHTYADGDAAFPITVDLVDEDGTHTSAGSKSVFVANVPPTLTLAGAAQVNRGTIFTLH